MLQPIDQHQHLNDAEQILLAARQQLRGSLSGVPCEAFILLLRAQYHINCRRMGIKPTHRTFRMDSDAA